MMAKASKVFQRCGGGAVCIRSSTGELEKSDSPLVRSSSDNCGSKFRYQKFLSRRHSSGIPSAGRGTLFLHEAGVAGDALPAAFGKDPGVGETPPMLVGLVLIGSFSVIDSDDHGGIGIHADLDILNAQAAGFELRVSDVGQKLALVPDFTVVLSVDELASDHASDGTVVASHL